MRLDIISPCLLRLELDHYLEKYLLQKHQGISVLGSSLGISGVVRDGLRVIHSSKSSKSLTSTLVEVIVEMSPSQAVE